MNNETCKDNRDTYNDNYLNALREEIVSIISEKLSPIAMKYDYSSSPLEESIKWKPKVLFLGNYSSGKSTLINELIGADVQKTGQAPTDDSFTVFDYEQAENGNENISLVNEREGRSVLNDSDLPFFSLKKHGDRFSSHFKLKTVNSPILKNLAMIDTPGMLDSTTSTARGYDYLEVIGELAQTSDLVIILFDPHKAGTGTEFQKSISETLPKTCFEDRIAFCMSRTDECSSLSDLLNVYGTLCWNLSQMTGRKDIPPIFLTYSQKITEQQPVAENPEKFFMSHIQNHRLQLRDMILNAPRHQLDHLSAFLETNAEKLEHMLEGFLAFREAMRKYRIKMFFFYLLYSLIVLSATGGVLFGFGLANYVFLASGAACALGFTTLLYGIIGKFFTNKYFKNLLSNIDLLTRKNNQSRIDSWAAVRKTVKKYIEETKGKISIATLKKELILVKETLYEDAPEVRQGLKELSEISKNFS